MSKERKKNLLFDYNKFIRSMSKHFSERRNKFKFKKFKKIQWKKKERKNFSENFYIFCDTSCLTQKITNI